MELDSPNSPRTILWLVISILVLLRLLNNLLKAGYFNLGQISRLSLAERARDTGGHLSHFMQDPQRLTFSTQLVDKISLCVLLALLYLAKRPLDSLDFGLLLGYVVVFDVVITNAFGSFYPEQLVTGLFRLLRFVYLFVSPVVMLMIKISQRGRLHIEGDEDEEDDPEDIRAFLQAGTEEGIIEEKEKHLLRNLLVFSDTVVREVMTPRTDMICVEHTASPEEILRIFRETKFSRLPVYRENIDQIEGVLRLKDLLEVVDKHDDLSGYLKPTMFVPEMKSISDLLEEMLKERMQMVIVIDEYGGTAGLITLEDLIEEIVGEIHDEHEAPEADQIITLENGDLLIDGKITLEDFCEMFGTEADNEDVDTVGGYIFNKSGRIPDVGHLCEVCGIPVEVARADQRRIYQVKVAAPVVEPQLSESEPSED